MDSARASPKINGMSKRTVASVLWFAATWFAYEIGWSVMQMPRLAGPIVAFVVAIFIAVDPLGVFWARSARPDPGLVRAGTNLETPTSNARQYVGAKSDTGFHSSQS